MPNHMKWCIILIGIFFAVSCSTKKNTDNEMYAGVYTAQSMQIDDLKVPNVPKITLELYADSTYKAMGFENIDEQIQESGKWAILKQEKKLKLNKFLFGIILWEESQLKLECINTETKFQLDFTKQQGK